MKRCEKFCLTSRTRFGGRNYLEKMGSVTEEGGGPRKEFAAWTKHREYAQGFATVKQAEAMRRIVRERYAVETEIVPRGEAPDRDRHGIPKGLRNVLPDQ